VRSLSRVPAHVVDGGVTYRVPAARWSCLGGCRVHGECVGERERTGGGQHDGGQRRPVASRFASVRVLARVGVSGRGLGAQLLVNADVVSGQRVHGQLQEGQGRSIDKVRGDGCERRE
jgi:hypothetical protein